MALTKSQKYISVAVVIAIIAAIVVGAWYLSNTDAQEPSKDAKEMANKFVESYDGPFGPLELNSTSTSDNAVLMKENDSSRLKYSKMNYTITSDAKSRFDEIKSAIEDMEGFMGGTPTEVQGITGFDDICAYKMDVQMGTMTKFTLIYFVAYIDGVLVESFEDAMYLPGSLATDSEITEFFEAVLESISS